MSADDIHTAYERLARERKATRLALHLAATVNNNPDRMYELVQALAVDTPESAEAWAALEADTGTTNSTETRRLVLDLLGMGADSIVKARASMPADLFNLFTGLDR